MPFLNSSGADIFYEITGEGRPAFVLVHGGMCDHRDWDMVLPLLCPRHAVMTLDLRAHGRSGGSAETFSVESCATDLNALIDTLGLGPALLVGHSLAARIVAEAALARSENVLGLILLDGSRTNGGDATSRPVADQLTSPMKAPLSDILSKTIGPFAAEADRARLLDRMSATSPAVMAACVATITSWDQSSADTVFAGLPDRIPVLALQSTYHDRFTSRRSLGISEVSTPYLDFLREKILRLSTRLLPGTGHFSMIERPKEIARLLLDFATPNCNDADTSGRDGSA